VVGTAAAWIRSEALFSREGARSRLSLDGERPELTALAPWSAAAVAGAIDFSAFGRVVDLGRLSRVVAATASLFVVQGERPK
jgi:hypothetical protein